MIKRVILQEGRSLHKLRRPWCDKPRLEAGRNIKSGISKISSAIERLRIALTKENG